METVTNPEASSLYPRPSLPPHASYSTSLNYFWHSRAYSSRTHTRNPGEWHIAIYHHPTCETWGYFTENYRSEKRHIEGVSLNGPQVLPKNVSSNYTLPASWHHTPLPYQVTWLTGALHSNSLTILSDREGRAFMRLRNFQPPLELAVTCIPAQWISPVYFQNGRVPPICLDPSCPYFFL